MWRVFDYTLLVSMGTMIDRCPTLGFGPWSVFMVMTMTLLHTPGSITLVLLLGS